MTGGRERRELDPGAIEAARRASPEAFLRRHYGRAVQMDRSGRSIRVSKVLRADRNPDGASWIACDWQGGGIGDSIAIVRWATGCGFIEALEALVGDPTRPLPVAHPPPPPPPKRPPRLPRLDGVDEGREYLLGRGISQETIRAAELARAIHYVRGAVIFLGRDHASAGAPVRLATLRYLEPIAVPDEEPMTKRDMAGSDKDFPVFLPGDPERVIVVEGGVNALAAQDILIASGEKAPVVIATGGVGVRSWVKCNTHLRGLLQAAGRVELWCENEVSGTGLPDPEKQAKTDLLRERLSEEIALARGGELPSLVYPPLGIKDTADWLTAGPAASPPPPSEATGMSL